MPSPHLPAVACGAMLVALLLPAALLGAATPLSFLEKPDAWFASDDGKRVMANVISQQRPSGGWWKAYDAEKPRDASKELSARGLSTFDNNATWGELRLLARAIRVTGDTAYRAAFDRGLASALAAQYDNGGWPQQYPLPGTEAYAGHITYNDDGMTSVLRLIGDVAAGEGDFAFVPPETRQQCRRAFDKGIDCILATQIRIDGKPAAWCAQHDAKTLAPAKARAYELPSLSGGESANIALLLMSLPHPDDRVKAAVRGVVAWYERSAVRGVREERRPTKESNRGYDVVHVSDPAAPPMWARFYDLDTGKPYYCGRDGVKKATLAEIELERRAGYAWLRPWGKKVLDAYPAWAAKHGG